MTNDLSLEHITHLEVVRDLYPVTLGEQFSEDKNFLMCWLADVAILETLKSSGLNSSTNVALQISCYRQLLKIISRRYEVAEIPDDATGQFDYGRERKHREEVLVNIQKLADIVIGFYGKNTNLLADKITSTISDDAALFSIPETDSSNTTELTKIDIESATVSEENLDQEIYDIFSDFDESF